METNKVELKQIQKISEAVTYLEGLLKGLKAGRIVVQHGDNFVSLVPAEQVQIDVSAKKKKDKEKFSLVLSWHAATADGVGPIKITTKEPICTTPSTTKGKKSEPSTNPIPPSVPVKAKAVDKNKPTLKK